MRRERSLCFGLRRRKNDRWSLVVCHWLYRTPYFLNFGPPTNPDMDTNSHPADQIEERLINFAVRIIGICGKLPASYASEHIAKQVLRSGTAPAPHYGEAR